jgi:branched-chain amino acid transport system ATP-binding protein
MPTSEADPLLAVTDLTVRYGRASAVMEVSMEVARGQVVALIGPNGAGKSTTLNTIAGLLKPSAGDIRFHGESIAGRTPESLVRRGIALVPEGRQIFASLSVRENLRLPTAGLRRAEAHKMIERELERFPALAERLSDPAGALSGGQQQQLAIARSLLCRPELLLLDEPSLGLAPLIVDAVFDALATLREEGVTILLVEQNAVRATEFADYTYVLRSGRVVLEGSRESFSDIDQLTDSYLGGTATEPTDGEPT